MDKEYPPGFLAALYFKVLGAARSLGEGTLHRLLDLHNRYPEDLPTKAIEPLLQDPPPPGDLTPPPG
jgi:hypothetical protein